MGLGRLHAEDVRQRALALLAAAEVGALAFRYMHDELRYGSARGNFGRSSILASLLCNPLIDVLLEHVERHASSAEHTIVELGKAEPVAERALGFLAKLDDLQLTDHVATGLTRLRDIALHLGFRSKPWKRTQVFDGLRTGPVLRVEARVDDESLRPEQLHLKLP